MTNSKLTTPEYQQQGNNMNNAKIKKHQTQKGNR